MNKKIIISLSIIGAVAALAIGGTIAYFSDTETSIGNTFTAGTINLQVGDNDPITWKFIADDIKPGGTDWDKVLVQNTGGNAGYLHITFANLVNDENGCAEPESGVDVSCDNPGSGQGELAENLDVLIYIDEAEIDHFDLGLDTLIYQGKARGILEGDLFNYYLPVGASESFKIKWSLDSSVGNIVQTDSTGFDIVFELTQNKKEIVGIAPQLTIVKHVINNDGGQAVAENWIMDVTATNPSQNHFAGSEAGVTITINAGSYSVDESGGPSGYAKSLSTDCSGTIALGQTRTCTITNDDVQPLLTVTKVVSGGTKQVGDFPLFVDATPVTSGVQNGFNAGAYTVSETPQQNYTAVISGDCASDGSITLNIGDVKSCTITNTYVPPQPVTVNLNPDYGYDMTDSPYTLTASDLAKLATSDDVRYGSRAAWDSAYSDNEYIEFVFPDIPAGATVNSVVLKFEWQRGGYSMGYSYAVEYARLRISGDDGYSWQTHSLDLPDYYHKWGESYDGTATIDLKSLYSIDTAAEVNALRIWFQAIDPHNVDRTRHDWVQVDVTYIP